MLSLGRCGQHKEACQIAEQLRQAYPKDASILCSAAMGFAVCAGAVTGKDGDQAADSSDDSLAEQYGKSAVETLRSAIETGYELTPEIRLDPDAESLLDRADFQQLLQEHEASDAENPTQE